MPLLPHAQILRLHLASVSAGLSESRSALLGGVDPVFVTTLPAASSLGAQLLHDLTALNAVPELRDGTVPLRIWLETAMHLAGPRVEADVFREALSLLRAADPGRAAEPHEPRLPATGAIVKPLKRRALLDRRLAADLLVSYPGNARSRPADAQIQLSNVYALSIFENILVENHFGSILFTAVSRDDLLRETILFVPHESGDEPSDLLEAVAEASGAWLDDPRFQLAASIYGRAKGNMSGSLAAEVAYLERMLLLARRFDAAIVPHPDRWPLYHHWFESCSQPPAEAERARRPVLLPDPVKAATEVISAQRAARVAQIAAVEPSAAPPVHLMRYGPMLYPFPTAYAKQRDLASLAAYPAFTYEFCTAGAMGLV